MDNVSFETFYSQNVIEWLLDLLSQAIDSNQLNKDHLLRGGNYKTYETMMLIINQNEYLELAGKACLVLSHFLWQNKKAQSLFGMP